MILCRNSILNAVERLHCNDHEYTPVMHQKLSRTNPAQLSEMCALLKTERIEELVLVSFWCMSRPVICVDRWIPHHIYNLNNYIQWILAVKVSFYEWRSFFCAILKTVLSNKFDLVSTDCLFAYKNTLQFYQIAHEFAGIAKSIILLRENEWAGSLVFQLIEREKSLYRRDF